jgi:septal ring factor EnvC (AmiA/AmiB activator)
VAALADAHRRQRGENAGLRRKVEEKARQIRALEERLLEANQKRQDVAKRIDELVAQLDHLDAQLARPQE